jgi:hypothetical protein
MVPINYLAVIVAAILAHVIGFLWYGPIMGKPWMKEMGMDPASMEGERPKGMAKMYILSFIGSLIMSYVLAHMLVYAAAYQQVSGISAGMMVAFWSWLVFIAPVTM